MSKRILIIDDDQDVLNALKVLLEDEYAAVITEHHPNRIARHLTEAFSVVLLDMNFSAGINSGNEGLFWLSKILEQQPGAAVVLMTAYGNITLAVEGIKRGAKDFVLKPWDNEKLLATLRAVVGQQKALSKTTQRYAQNALIAGKSEPMMALQHQVKKVAATDASVLLLGENGTGKEMIARELHRLSSRASQVFMSVDLSTLSEGLFESELFGHKKGAFTDARTDRKGRFEAAQGGTLFLDEIGNLLLSSQVKLLTVLQNREITPVGSNEKIPIDIRLISATNAPILQLASQGLFRQDLLYRINTITLNIPPLRERGEDILTLANHFLQRYAEQYGKSGIVLDNEAQYKLLRYHWPGNVRELQHTMEKAVILCNSDKIKSSELNLSISAQPVSGDLKTLDEMEKDALLQALRNHDGNILHAARALGITRQTFYNKMKKYGI